MGEEINNNNYSSGVGITVEGDFKVCLSNPDNIIMLKITDSRQTIESTNYIWDSKTKILRFAINASRIFVKYKTLTEDDYEKGIDILSKNSDIGEWSNDDIDFDLSSSGINIVEIDLSTLNIYATILNPWEHNPKTESDLITNSSNIDAAIEFLESEGYYYGDNIFIASDNTKYVTKKSFIKLLYKEVTKDEKLNDLTGFIDSESGKNIYRNLYYRSFNEDELEIELSGDVTNLGDDTYGLRIKKKKKENSEEEEYYKINISGKIGFTDYKIVNNKVEILNKDYIDINEIPSIQISYNPIDSDNRIFEDEVKVISGNQKFLEYSGKDTISTKEENLTFFIECPDVDNNVVVIKKVIKLVQSDNFDNPWKLILPDPTEDIWVGEDIDSWGLGIESKIPVLIFGNSEINKSFISIQTTNRDISNAIINKLFTIDYAFSEDYKLPTDKTAEDLFKEFFYLDTNDITVEEKLESGSGINLILHKIPIYFTNPNVPKDFWAPFFDTEQQLIKTTIRLEYEDQKYSSSVYIAGKSRNIIGPLVYPELGNDPIDYVSGKSITSCKISLLGSYQLRLQTKSDKPYWTTYNSDGINITTVGTNVEYGEYVNGITNERLSLVLTEDFNKSGTGVAYFIDLTEEQYRDIQAKRLDIEDWKTRILLPTSTFIVNRSKELQVFWNDPISSQSQEIKNEDGNIIISNGEITTDFYVNQNDIFNLNVFSDCNTRISLSSLYNNSPIGFMVIDNDGKYTITRQSQTLSPAQKSDSSKVIFSLNSDIILPETFSGCTDLIEIIIPNTIKTIGARAFKGCTNLTEIYIPSSVNSIGEEAFSGCSNLKTINFGENISEISASSFVDTLWYDNLLNSKDADVVYAGNVLLRCKSANTIKSVIVKDGTKVIADGAFKECEYIEEITIPDSVKSIGNDVFTGCSRLVTLTFGYSDSPINVGYGNEFKSILSNLNSLKNIKISRPVNYTYCKEDGIIKKVSEVDDFLEKDNKYLYNSGAKFYTDFGYELIEYPLIFSGIGNSETVITLHESDDKKKSSIKKIRNKEFKNCLAKEIQIPDTITEIGHEAFYGCSNLAEINISKTSELTEIRDNAFRGCKSLTNVNIKSEKLEKIGKLVFFDCTNLEDNINICLNSVNEIGGGILTNTKKGKFFKNKDNKCVWNKNTKNQLLTLDDTENEKSWIIDFNNSDDDSGDEYLNLTKTDDYDNKTFVGICNDAANFDLYFENKNLANNFWNCVNLIYFPSTLKYIGKRAFKGCWDIQDVDFSEISSGLRFGEDAFYGCGENLAIAHTDSIDSWLSFTFENRFANPLTNTTYLYIGGHDNNATLVNRIEIKGKDIPDYAFTGLYLDDKHLAVIGSLGERGYIGKYAFYSDQGYKVNSSNGTYSLTHSRAQAVFSAIYLTGVKEIGEYAFEGRPSVGDDESGTDYDGKAYGPRYTGRYDLHFDASDIRSIGDKAFYNTDYFKHQQNRSGGEGSIYPGTGDNLIYFYYYTDEDKTKNYYNNSDVVKDTTERNIANDRYFHIIGYSSKSSIKYKTFGDYFGTCLNGKTYKYKDYTISPNKTINSVSRRVVGLSGCNGINYIEPDNISINSSFLDDRNSDYKYFKFFGEKALQNLSRNVRINIDLTNTIVEYFGRQSFENCNVIKVDFSSSSDSDITIDEKAFKDCPIEEIKITDKVKTVEKDAFLVTNEFDKKLEELYLPSLVTWCTGTKLSNIYSNPMDNLIEGGKVYYLNSTSSSYIELSENFVLNELTTGIDNSNKISDYSFSNLRLIKSFEDKGNISIGKYAFYGCDNLISVKLSNKINSIGDYAFYRDGDLETLVVDLTEKTTAPNIGTYSFNPTNTIIKISSEGITEFYEGGWKELVKIIVAPGTSTGSNSELDKSNLLEGTYSDKNSNNEINLFNNSSNFDESIDSLLINGVEKEITNVIPSTSVNSFTSIVAYNLNTSTPEDMQLDTIDIVTVTESGDDNELRISLPVKYKPTENNRELSDDLEYIILPYTNESDISINIQSDIKTENSIESVNNGYINGSFPRNEVVWDIIESASDGNSDKKNYYPQYNSNNFSGKFMYSSVKNTYPLGKVAKIKSYRSSDKIIEIPVYVDAEKQPKISISSKELNPENEVNILYYIDSSKKISLPIVSPDYLLSEMSNGITTGFDSDENIKTEITNSNFSIIKLEGSDDFLLERVLNSSDPDQSSSVDIIQTIRILSDKDETVSTILRVNVTTTNSEVSCNISDVPGSIDIDNINDTHTISYHEDGIIKSILTKPFGTELESIEFYNSEDDLKSSNKISDDIVSYEISNSEQVLLDSSSSKIIENSGRSEFNLTINFPGQYDGNEIDEKYNLPLSTEDNAELSNLSNDGKIYYIKVNIKSESAPEYIIEGNKFTIDDTTYEITNKVKEGENDYIITDNKFIIDGVTYEIIDNIVMVGTVEYSIIDNKFTVERDGTETTYEIINTVKIGENEYIIIDNKFIIDGDTYEIIDNIVKKIDAIYFRAKPFNTEDLPITVFKYLNAESEEDGKTTVVPDKKELAKIEINTNWEEKDLNFLIYPQAKLSDVLNFGSENKTIEQISGNYSLSIDGIIGNENSAEIKFNCTGFDSGRTKIGTVRVGENDYDITTDNKFTIGEITYEIIDDVVKIGETEYTITDNKFTIDGTYYEIIYDTIGSNLISNVIIPISENNNYTTEKTYRYNVSVDSTVAEEDIFLKSPITIELSNNTETAINAAILSDYIKPEQLPQKMAINGVVQDTITRYISLAAGESAIVNLYFKDITNIDSKDLFSGCTYITSVILPDGMLSVGKNMFSSCWNLEVVGLPYSITKLSESCFYDCQSLVNVSIPCNGVTEIGDNAFEKCINLAHMVLPGSIKKLGRYIFKGCYNLWDVIIKDGIPYLPNDMFGGCVKLTYLHIAGTGKDSTTTLPKIIESDGSTVKGSGFIDLTKNLSISSVSGGEKTNFVNAGFKNDYEYQFTKDAGYYNRLITITYKNPPNKNYIICCYYKNSFSHSSIDGWISETVETHALHYVGWNSKWTTDERKHITVYFLLEQNYLEDKEFWTINGRYSNTKQLFGLYSSDSYINLPDNYLKHIGGKTFDDFGAKYILLPKSLEGFGPSAFYNCRKLKSITFGDSIEYFGTYQQEYDPSIIYKTREEVLTTTGKTKENNETDEKNGEIFSIFGRCFELIHVEIPEIKNPSSSLKFDGIIPYKAFKECRKLSYLGFKKLGDETEVTVSGEDRIVTYGAYYGYTFGKQALYGCQLLHNLYFKTSISLGNDNLTSNLNEIIYSQNLNSIEFDWGENQVKKPEIYSTAINNNVGRLSNIKIKYTSLPDWINDDSESNFIHDFTNLVTISVPNKDLSEWRSRFTEESFSQLGTEVTTTNDLFELVIKQGYKDPGTLSVNGIDISPETLSNEYNLGIHSSGYFINPNYSIIDSNWETITIKLRETNEGLKITDDTSDNSTHYINLVLNGKNVYNKLISSEIEEDKDNGISYSIYEVNIKIDPNYGRGNNVTSDEYPLIINLTDNEGEIVTFWKLSYIQGYITPIINMNETITIYDDNDNKVLFGDIDSPQVLDYDSSSGKYHIDYDFNVVQCEPTYDNGVWRSGIEAIINKGIASEDVVTFFSEEEIDEVIYCNFTIDKNNLRNEFYYQDSEEKIVDTTNQHETDITGNLENNKISISLVRPNTNINKVNISGLKYSINSYRLYPDEDITLDDKPIYEVDSWFTYLKPTTPEPGNNEPL